jgi:hypothetical protein
MRRQLMMTKDLLYTIVARFLEDQNSAREENTLKIEIAKNSHSSNGEDEEQKKH